VAVRSKSFRDLTVWQKAHRFVLDVYAFTGRFPGDEKFGLTAQMRRAAVSVPANIVEGFSRRGSAEKKRFYNISKGSLEECRYFAILANDLGYGNAEQIMERIDEVGRLIDGYSRSF
jgi:four helix bundle protein